MSPSDAPESVGTGRLLERYVMCESEDPGVFASELRAAFYPSRIRRAAEDSWHGISSLYVVRDEHYTVSVSRPGVTFSVEVEIEHTSYHVNVPLAGTMKSVAGETSVRAHPHRAAVFSARRRHYLDAWEPDAPAIGVKFDRALMEDELARLAGRPIVGPIAFDAAFDLTTPSGRSWRWMVLQMVRQLNEDGSILEHAEVRMHYVRSLASALLLSQRHTHSEVLDGGRRPGPRTLVRASRFIENNSRNQLTVGDIAEVAGCSVRRLQETFRQHFGVSPMAYLRDVRLEDARAELRAGAGTVGAVAYRTGFAHIGRFSAAYRERFGEAPSATLRAG